ncbi:unnamed protein product [Lactuca saligna]|uniref:Uncharacterized protein n=1 Tax=Lactuca saligna TaxID=75948 RepID=A0AA35UYY6_LACSI|nr:unnamed protein product [Lactuca saligna]
MESLIKVYVAPVNEPNMEPFSEPLGGSSDSEGSEDLSDSDDSDFFVDEDNLLDDPEVDMLNFDHIFYDNLGWIGDTLVTKDNVLMSDEEVGLSTQMFYNLDHHPMKVK